MKIGTASWVHRTVRSLERFADARDDSRLRDTYAWLGVPVIGVYRNPDGSWPAEILITETMMLMGEADTWDRVRFDSVVAVHSPEKASGGRVVLELDDGKRPELVVGGSQGKFEDVFEFVRFLLRVTAHRRGGAENNIAGGAVPKKGTM